MSIVIRDRARKSYMVVGCHGSATSLIVRGLRKCGVMMGHWLVTNVYEPAAIRKLNDKILAAAGGSWRDPPPEEAILSVDFGEEIQAALERYEGEAMWGFKDPRLSLTGRLFLPYLAEDAYLICCFRKPERLLSSLEARGYEVSRGLVDRYNRGIVSLIEDFCGLT